MLTSCFGMKFYPSWFVFFVFTLVSIVFVLSADNWFLMWLGFELSLLSFIPMFFGPLVVVEGLVKYFLVQVGGSSVFVLSFLSCGFFSQEGMFLVLGMFMKLGVFPFYSWVPMLMSVLTWCGCLLLSSFQKMGPLFVVCQYSFVNSNCVLFFSALSILVGGVMGYNQSYMRSLMGYSSISHTGWLLVSCIYSFSVFLLYLIVYFVMVITLFSIFSFLKIHKVVVGGFGLKSWGVVTLLILSVSGIPPFSLFYLKMVVISFIISNYFYVFFVLLGSMLSAYYYLTFSIPSVSSFWFYDSKVVFDWLTFLCVFISFFFPLLFFL